MISLVFWFSVLLHPIHVSVSEVNYSEKDKALQITSRIFTDDLETAIRRKRNEPELDLLSPPAGLTTDGLISDYLKEHFTLAIDGKVQKMVLLGTEKEGFATICYLEIAGVKKAKSIEVYNTTITEVHDDQSNLVHVTFKGPIKSARLMKNTPSEVFKYGDK